MQQNLGQAQTKTEQKIVSIYFVKKTGAAESLVETTKKFLSLFVLLQHTTATSFQRKKTICKKEKKSCFCRFFACFYFNHTFSASYLQLEQKGGKKNSTIKPTSLRKKARKAMIKPNL